MCRWAEEHFAKEQAFFDSASLAEYERHLAAETDVMRRRDERSKAAHPAVWAEWLKVWPLLDHSIAFGQRFDFDWFLREVGSPPGPRAEVGRKDEEIGFVPGNLVWQTPHQLLKANEVADRLNCGPTTVYDLIRRGEVKSLSLTEPGRSTRRGRKAIRVFADSVSEFIERQTFKPKTEIALSSALSLHDPVPKRARTRTSSRSGRFEDYVVIPFRN